LLLAVWPFFALGKNIQKKNVSKRSEQLFFNQLAQS